jgi:hypothetical protein
VPKKRRCSKLNIPINSLALTQSSISASLTLDKHDDDDDDDDDDMHVRFSSIVGEGQGEVVSDVSGEPY